MASFVKRWSGASWSSSRSAPRMRAWNRLTSASVIDGVRARCAPTWTLPTSCGAAVCGEWYDAKAGWFLLATSAVRGPQ